MAIDNRIVVRLLDDVLARQFRQHPGDRLVTLVWFALDELVERRNSPTDRRASLDENLAAAEHYMVARYAVGSSAYRLYQMILMVSTYEHFKMLIACLPANTPWGAGRMLEQLMRHNPGRPLAPPSQELVRWGVRGAWDGERDRLAIRGPVAPAVALPPAFAPILGGGI